MSSIAATAAPARKLTMESGHDARAKNSMRSVSTYIQRNLISPFSARSEQIEIANFASTGSSTALRVARVASSGPDRRLQPGQGGRCLPRQRTRSFVALFLDSSVGCFVLRRRGQSWFGAGHKGCAGRRGVVGFGGGAGFDGGAVELNQRARSGASAK